MACGDPKLGAVAKLLKPQIAEGANPVMFCRYIATAEHVAAASRRCGCIGNFLCGLTAKHVHGHLTQHHDFRRGDAWTKT